MHLAFPSGSAVKNPPAKTGDIGSISGLGRSPGEGNGNWLQYSYLKNPLDRGAWRATVHGVTKELGHNLATKQKQYTKHCQTHVLRSNCIYNFQKVSYNKLQWYSISIIFACPLALALASHSEKTWFFYGGRRWRETTFCSPSPLFLFRMIVPPIWRGTMHKPVCCDYIPQFGTCFGAARALRESHLATFCICKMKASG